MPLTALLLALAAAVVHAGWNLLTARAEQSQTATGVALCVGALAFAPVAALTWRLEATALPYASASVVLELAYFALLATAYERGPLSVVYPIARGGAPVLVAAVGVIALGASLLVIAATAVAYLAVSLRVGVAALRRACDARAAIGMFGAYALTLAALARADAAPVAAVRETSIVIATLLAAAFLHERVGRARLGGAAVVFAGVALVALG
jgi:multidrug transporter EmrE-like cation transporter